ASFGALKAGARVVYLNTDFAGPQAREVCAREGVHVLVYDEEFSAVVDSVNSPKGRVVAWCDHPALDAEGGPTLESLIASGSASPPPAPASPGTVIILTSGTTGTPKGANRTVPRSLTAAG